MLRSSGLEGPVQMLNLIRLRDVARYDDERSVPGRSAYAAYGRISAPAFAGVGGRIVWRGSWQGGLIGPAKERWDVCFIAEYPSIGAFASMLKDSAYREALIDRAASIEDSRLVCLSPLPLGTTFNGLLG